jgi:hypothetical protein
VFAICQAALRYALPRGVHVEKAPNKFGALLEPDLYRDIEITDMYLVEDIFDSMLVQDIDVPPFQATSGVKIKFQNAYQSVTSFGTSAYKSESKYDSLLEADVVLTKKMREPADYSVAKERFKTMLGNEDNTDDEDNAWYILRVLETTCNSLSLYEALSYYSVSVINNILQDDFGYRGIEVTNKKTKLLTVCDTFLAYYNDNI